MDLMEEDVKCDERPIEEEPEKEGEVNITGDIQTESEEVVQFDGLLFVKSPTSEKHIRYAMKIHCPQLALQVRCVERYRSFHTLRKRLLNTTRMWLMSPKNDFLPIEKRCPECQCILSKLERLEFPRRTLFIPTREDVTARSALLHKFLNVCIQELMHWSGCMRGKKLFALVLGRFVSNNIYEHLIKEPPLSAEPYESILEEKADEPTTLEVDNTRAIVACEA
uniref:Uncharacterized protein AlNc14C138G7160 n=1 Tax=Albugo laibachii Nc14 TaxID=890382 RepID=F0WKX0_9STRA|nr:conserved hypothetical protein [Albugo laibachii Nc14]CCA24779.1 conserved hypothetical protein [Albugo laibachii Nc14]|eukprot:CCA24779.1 conserved hypothetical protein [Albugo laibachii Nc14]